MLLRLLTTSLFFFSITLSAVKAQEDPDRIGNIRGLKDCRQRGYFLEHFRPAYLAGQLPGKGKKKLSPVIRSGPETKKSVLGSG